MQSAAGGTSHRLKPAFAIVCSRSRIPAPAPGTVPALLIVVIQSSPTAALCQACLHLRSLIDKVSGAAPSLPFVLCTIPPRAVFRRHVVWKNWAEPRLRVDRQKVAMVTVSDGSAACRVRLIVLIRPLPI